MHARTVMTIVPNQACDAEKNNSWTSPALIGTERERALAREREREREGGRERESFIRVRKECVFQQVTPPPSPPHPTYAHNTYVQN